MHVHLMGSNMAIGSAIMYENSTNNTDPKVRIQITDGDNHPYRKIQSK